MTRRPRRIEGDGWVPTPHIRFNPELGELEQWCTWHVEGWDLDVPAKESPDGSRGYWMLLPIAGFKPTVLSSQSEQSDNSAGPQKSQQP